MFKRRKSRRGSQAVCHEDRPQSRPGLLSYHLRLTQLLQRRQEQQQQQHRARESLPLHRNSSGEMRRSDQSDGRRAATWRLGSQAWVRLRSTPSSPRASGLRRNVFSFSSVLGQPRTPAQPPADDREDGADDGAEVDCQTQGNHQHHYRRRCLATIGAATFAADRDNRLDAARTSGWCGSPPPFQHLSNALPWASSARQMNSSLYLAQHLSPTADSNSNDRAMPATRLPGYESVPLGGSRPSTPSSSPFPPTKEQDQIQKAIDTLLLHQRMLVLLVKSIMIYGAPIHLNQNMERMAEFLDLEASLFILPGMAVISFDDSITHTSETKVLQCHHEWDMYRLEQTDKIWKHVVCHKMSVQEAVGELERLMNNGGYYPWYVLWPVWGILSWAVSLLAFRGGWTDGVCACGLGLLVGTMHLVASRFPAYANFFEVSAAMVSGFGASLFQRWVCYSSVALSSMAVLFPGLLMTTGVIELCSRQLISGTVRMFYALVLSFVIAFGLHIGNSIYTELFRHGQTVPASAQIESCTGLPPYFLFATVPVATTCIGMLIQVHWRHFVSINVVSGATFAIYWVFQNKLGLTSLAVTIASFSLGLMANTWSRFSGQTA
ncbi:pheromone-regulated protein prm10, partial [Spiromyces aspiralis]